MIALVRAAVALGIAAAAYGLCGLLPTVLDLPVVIVAVPAFLLVLGFGEAPDRTT